MELPLIAVTGRNGQAGSELERLAASFGGEFRFLFTDRNELDLSDAGSIGSFFQKNHPAYLINCAAYTAVDKAETEREAAYTINAEAVRMLATHCKAGNCVLVHLSTDYVFDGKGTAPYATDHETDPINYYGYTKWLGEQLARENNDRTVIIRTSWVYSEFGKNFVRTMLKLMSERKDLNVVDDQLGSPTYAADLAAAIMTIIRSFQKGNTQYGTYHFSNKGVISWFDFAVAIRDLSG
ncbi:MAG: rfbD, partial [Sediminibacterium sp.]|nr:rfbD [Sediminibacterium sp.]